MKLETFFEKFDQFADAPDAVAKMRELILLLALDGKIGDTDAATWERVQLGDLGEWGSGGTPLSTESRYYDGNIPWLIIGDLNDGVVTSSMKTITEEGLASSSARMLPKNVLLIAMYGSIGKLGITGIECATNQAIAFCKPEPERADLRYLFHAFMGLRPKFLSRGQGLAQKNISQRILRAWEIGLPPLAEQKRIVVKVDELMALCDRLEAQQQERETRHAALARASLARFADAPTPANLPFLFHPSYAIPPADLRKSILTLAVQGKLVPQDPNDQPASEFVRRFQVERKDFFEAEVIRARREGIRPPRPPRNGFVPHVDEEDQDIPYTWCVTRVGDVSDCLDYLRVPVNKGERLAASGTVPYYGANGQVGWIDKHLFDEDLVLVVEDETFIGRIKPFSYVIRGKSWVNNHAHVLRPLGGMTADFLNLVLCRYPFIPLTSGTTNRRKLTQPSLMDAQISLPPLAEQHRIATKVEQLMALVDALETQLAASRATAANLLSPLVAELTGTASRLPVNS